VSINTVGIVGSGIMAGGLTEVVARGGHQVIVRARKQAGAEATVAGIAANLDKQVSRDKLGADERDATLARISATDSLDALAGCDLVIESVVEDLAVKRALFTDLDEAVKPGAILATNTSSIPLEILREDLPHPGGFVGIHFFNPVPLMALVEVVVGAETSEATVAAARGFAEAVGKTPITVKDSPGFVVNRILVPMINEAAAVYHEKVASAQDIDTAMKLGANWPMGPLALADLVGLDTTCAILETLERELGDAKYRPSPALTELRDAGRLGRKSGSGFYDYGK